MFDIETMKNASRVFDFFYEISKIPHTSGNTEKIADYLVEFAKERGLECYRDKYDNVIIKKDATNGYEDKEPIILQGHTDMVMAVEENLDIDMTKSGIKIKRDGDFLKAEGTTLGADDGVFMAYALAILDADDIKHPRLEVLFTSDEETGLAGAENFDATLLSGKRMINIDSDVEGIFIVGCAGGMRVDVTLPYTQKEYCEGLYTVKVSGLLGGHSGMEINKNRGNAIKILSELIFGSRISSVVGGNADNAIPRSAVALIIPNSIKELNDRVCEIKKKYEACEPSIKITVTELKESCPVYSLEDSLKIAEFIFKMPTDIYKMSEDIEQLPETSSNLGLIDTTDGRVKLSSLIRSAKDREKKSLAGKIIALANEYGAESESHSEYPAWEYKKDSFMRDSMKRIYEATYNKTPQLVIIHAGLECGIFSQKIKDLDCVSIGPDMFDIHTTEERLNIPSTIRVFEYILKLLEEL